MFLMNPSTRCLPSYISQQTSPLDISKELGRVLHTKHWTPALRAALAAFLPCSSSLAGSSLMSYMTVRLSREQQQLSTYRIVEIGDYKGTPAAIERGR